MRFASPVLLAAVFLFVKSPAEEIPPATARVQSTQVQSTGVQSTEVRSILENQRDAWNRGDLAAFMQTYWHSPDLTFFSGNKIVRGWQPTFDRYRTRYGSGTAQMGHLSFTDDHIQMLGSEAALVTATWHLLMPDGRNLAGLTTVICRRMPDGWKIIHDHSS